MTSAVVYVRISRDPEGRQVGVERQQRDCRELAARLGIDVVRVFADNDVSASTLSSKRRPAFEEMMTLAEAGRAPVILAYSNSRLTRRPLELERLIIAHDRTGVEFRTVVSGQDDLSTADGRMVARIKASVDAAESERIGERTRRAKQEAREQGRFPGGWRPYGWDADGTTVRDDEAAIIVETTRAVLAGQSVTSLVRSLNDRGLTSSTGKQWSTRTLLRVLTRVHPAVSEGEGEALRLLLRDPARRTTPGPERRWLLSGLALCQICGVPLRGSGSSLGSGRGSYPAYRCRTGKHVVINAVVLDEFIGAVVVERLSRDDAAELFTVPTADTSSQRAEASSLRVRLDALADDIDIDERTLQRRAKALQQRLDAVEEELTAAAAAGPLAAYAELAERRAAAAVWAELGLARRRAVVRALMDITVQRGARGTVPAELRWRKELTAFDPRRVVVEWRV